MIHFYIKNQNLSFYSPVVAADSLNYLSCRFRFEGGDWNDTVKWAHFRCGETVYDLQLDSDDEIKSSAGLNLHTGYWQIYLTGHGENLRLTTGSVIMQVIKSGLVDAPLHQLPQTVAEQLTVRCDAAFDYAKAVHDAAQRGDYTGQSFQVLGYYPTLSALEQAVTQPDRGSVYAVGSAAPYDIYIWDCVNLSWVNNGPVQGVRGDRGQDGACFIPALDASGNLSWSNSAGLENPESVNIMGPRGETGAAGADGLSPFEAAVKEGFTGTASTFNAALAMLPQHAERHKSGGADALPAGSVSADMLCENAVSRSFTLSLAAADWSDKCLTAAAGSVTDFNTLIVSPAPESHRLWCECAIRCVAQAAGSLTFRCDSVPDAAVTVNVTAINR